MKNLLIILIFNYLIGVAQADDAIKIGVLSHRGDEKTLKVWSPIAEHLSSELRPTKFKIIPIDFSKIEENVKNNRIDFILVNPGIYVNLEVRYRISRLVTLNKIGANKLLNKFGGVTFALKNNFNINTFKDLIGKKVVAVDEISLGGYQMILRELNHLDIKTKNFSKIEFAGTHDKVVMAVKGSEYDVGMIRTGILEKMSKEGRIDLNNYKIISEKKSKKFPLMHSTRLYPEWPFSKLQHTNNQLAQKVAMSLMNMPDIHKQKKEIDYSGWTIPLDYQEVHDLFKELSISPYDKVNFTLKDAIKKYSVWIIIIAIFLVILIVLAFIIIRLNQKLKHSKQYLVRQQDLILASVCDGIYGVDLEGNCTFVNKSMEKLSGWTEEDMIGKNQHEILHHSYADGSPHKKEDCPVYSTITDKKPRFVNEDLFWRKDGSNFQVEYSSTPVKDNRDEIVGSVVVFRDISERKKSEENQQNLQNDLIHMARLNTMGEMVSGIAHELNQPLTAIATNAYACINLLESGQYTVNDTIDILERINTHAEKSGKIIKQLRRFIKKEPPKYKKINIIELIDDILILMQPEIKKTNTKIILEYKKELPIVYCQPIQIDQVILNLCKNAIESMNERDKKSRELTINAVQGGNNAVIITISDTGVGLNDKLLTTLFDPFISSKSSGMGLGLSISKGIIEAHNGNIYVANNSKEGCSIRFTIPINNH